MDETVGAAAVMDLPINNNNILMDENNNRISGILSLSLCFLLSILYVTSLYVWKSDHSRDHPSTVKRRFCSVFCVTLVSPIFIYLFTASELYVDRTIWDLMGFRTPGLYMAFFTPLILTSILFLGPLSTQASGGVWFIYAEPMYWVHNFKNILWIRNHIVAPLSEEFTFRACMLPLLLQSFKPLTAVLVTPFFFGIAHLHHIFERIKSGVDIKSAIIVTAFQFGYTSIFGMYSAYLFARTGHFMAPLVAHAFCNHMGFPDVQEVFTLTNPKKQIILALYVVGLVSWFLLLPRLTEPTWYLNDLYWSKGLQSK